MKRFWRATLMAAGLALFGWFVYQAEPERIFAAFDRLGWAAPVILLPYWVVFATDSFAYYLAFPKEQRRRLKYRSALAARWAGQSINLAVPTAHVAGEAAKVWLLRARGVPAVAAAGAAVISKTLQTLSNVVYIALGAWAYLQLDSAGPHFKRGMAVASAGALGFALFLFWLQTHGLFTLFFRALKRLKINAQSIWKHRPKLLEIDRHVLRFYREDRKQFFVIAAVFLAGWLLDTVEIYLVGQLIGMPITITQALAVEAFIAVAKGIGAFMPGALGVQEAGIVILCRAAGLSDAFAIAYAVIRRGREVVFVLIGWSILYARHLSWRQLKNLRDLESLE